VSPYNFPLLAMVGKVAPALFAGNAVVMKPAPQDPLLVVALAEALRDGLAAVGAPPAVSALLTGSTPELGAALVGHPQVDGVSFTGSTTVGIEIHRNASAGMKRLLLELGGKGACVVRADADLDLVVESVLRTWVVQSGQVCLTPARLIADHRVHDELVRRLTERLCSLRVGDPSDPAIDVGPVISDAQRKRVEGLVAAAEAAGRRVVRGDRGPVTGYFTPPALVLDCEPADEIMQEEVFGPVLCVTSTRDDDEAVAAANSTRYGLYDYVFSADPAAARALAGRLKAAQVGINTVRRHPGAPFGGNRASGIGRSGGRHALEACTDVQTFIEPHPKEL
jgi:acyl-CoA reductase-like NAD-dependent aldehyde dehydrogenase